MNNIFSGWDWGPFFKEFVEIIKDLRSPGGEEERFDEHLSIESPAHIAGGLIEFAFAFFVHADHVLSNATNYSVLGAR